MATTRIRRAGGNPPAYAVDQDGDRIYTEDDYAAKEPLPDEWEADDAYAAAGWTGESYLPDESFLPDEEDVPVAAWSSAAAYTDYDEEDNAAQFDGADFEDADPLDEELLTDEERDELRRSRWQLLAGLADFAGVILGTAAILILVTLLVSLLNWLVNDVNQSFILLQKNL